MKKKTLINILAVVLVSAMLVGCEGKEPVKEVKTSSIEKSSSRIVSSLEPTSSETSSAVSSEFSSLAPTSDTGTSVFTSSEASIVESQPKSSSKVPASSKALASSQPPKATESKPVAKETPNFGELMDEMVVDAIIAEGIEYANSKGMTWYDDFSIEDSGYYNPAFSGDGAEIFKRDLLYHIDQVYDISVNDSYYKEGNGIAFKIVKGVFKKGYWYGYVLY